MNFLFELTICGQNVNINQFISDHIINGTWTIPDANNVKHELLKFNGGYEEYLLTFCSKWKTTREWLKKNREKHTSLEFCLFWRNEYTVPSLGFIESNGEELELDSQDLKIACKLLKEYKNKSLACQNH